MFAKIFYCKVRVINSYSTQTRRVSVANNYPKTPFSRKSSQKPNFSPSHCILLINMGAGRFFLTQKEIANLLAIFFALKIQPGTI